MQWNHSIPQKLVRGILVGYRVHWDEDFFSSDKYHDSKGHVDVGLNISDYTITSLHEHWLYKISVAGRTSVGHGVYTTVTLMTEDDGKGFTKFSDISTHSLNQSVSEPLNFENEL